MCQCKLNLRKSTLKPIRHYGSHFLVLFLFGHGVFGRKLRTFGQPEKMLVAVGLP